MKKFIFVLLALCMAFAIVSCSKKADPDPTPDPVAKTFTVTFDSRGGSQVQSQTVKSGSLITEPSKPTKDGSTFLGWIADEAGEYWKFASDTVSQDMTLYAQWTAVKPKAVTIMYYSAGGGNLDYKQAWKMRQCASVGATDEVNMTFEYKFSTEQQESDDFENYTGVLRMDLADAASMKGCKVYSMTKKNTLNNIEGLPFSKYSSDASLDMSNPDEISNFIKWSVSKHPADKYVLIFADHGGGWSILDDEAGGIATKGVIYDDNVTVGSYKRSKCVSAKNIASGIKQSGVSIEVLYLDACLMSAWENLYEYKEAAVKYVVSSMEVSYGGNYRLMLGEIIKTPSSPLAAFKRYIDRHMANFETGWDSEYVDMGIVDVSRISAMTSVIKEIGNTLKEQIGNSDKLISSTSSACFRLALMSQWNSVWTPAEIGKKIYEIYAPSYTVSNDQQWYSVSSNYVMLLRQNHEDVWNAFSDKDRDNAVYNIMNQPVYGLAFGDILQQYKKLWDETTIEGYEAQKTNATRMYDSYVQTLKSMAYINCNHKMFDDQPYVELSPSVNVMAMNEAGWHPWEMPYRAEYNTILMAKYFDLDEAISLYGQSTFAKETGWGSVLKANPFNPSALSNDSRATRYYTK